MTNYKKSFKSSKFESIELIESAKVLEDSISHVLNKDYHFLGVIATILRGWITDKARNNTPLLLRIIKECNQNIELFSTSSDFENEDYVYKHYSISTFKRLPTQNKISLDNFLNETFAELKSKSKNITKTVKDVINDYANNFGIAHFPEEIPDYISRILLLEKHSMMSEQYNDLTKKMQSISKEKNSNNSFIMPIYRLITTLAEIVLQFVRSFVAKNSEWDLNFTLLLKDTTENILPLFDVSLSNNTFLYLYLDNQCLHLELDYERIGSIKTDITLRKKIGKNSPKFITISHRLNKNWESIYYFSVNGVQYKFHIGRQTSFFGVPIEEGVLGRKKTEGSVYISLLGFTFVNFKKTNELHQYFKEQVSGNKVPWTKLIYAKYKPIKNPHFNGYSYHEDTIQ